MPQAESTVQLQPRPIAIEASDEVLAARVRAGDVNAFEPIVRRYNQRLFRVARSVLGDDDEAEDAVQDSYVNAFTRIDTWRPSGHLSAWLTRICLNQALMRRRSPAHARRTELDVNQHAATRDDDPQGNVERMQVRALMEAAIDRLPADLRTVFVMRAVQQSDTAETAVVLGIPGATVKTRLHRARRRLRTDLATAIESSAADAFSFAGARCERMVAGVMARLRVVRAMPAPGPSPPARAVTGIA